MYKMTFVSLENVIKSTPRKIDIFFPNLLQILQSTIC